MGRKASPLPADLENARAQFDQWRASSEPRSRVPRELWDLAVPLARKHGLSRVAKGLGVNYQSLASQLGKASESEKDAASAFVELDVNPSTAGSECLIELAERGGVKMTIRLSGSSSLDVVELARSFFKRRR